MDLDYNATPIDQRVVSTKQMIPTIKHQGYHITYALAELIDNSIQAEAKNIKILCADKRNDKTGRQQLESIAVFDDGYGMSKNELWNSVRLGESQNRRKGGIGKFGVGLTHASFSQCEKIDVYSWQKPDQIYHVKLDISSENIDSDIITVKEPIIDNIPDRWKNPSQHIPKSGTLVVWSKLDRIHWKKSSTLIKNSEFMMGRTYRKFLDQNKLKIQMISFDGDKKEPELEKTMHPNDPLYLMKNSSTPPPWNTTPMFQKDGKQWESVSKITGSDGKEYDVITRYSFVKKEIRNKKCNPNLEPWGKHAANNIGVSVIRAGRELTMDTSLLISYGPQERWWGAEIEFPPALDSIFGVSSNKQLASELSHVMQLVGKQNRDQQNSSDIDGETNGPLFDLVKHMSTRIRALRDQITKQKLQNLADDSAGHKPRLPLVPKPDGFSFTEQQIKKMTIEERKETLYKIFKHMGVDDPDYLPIDSPLIIHHVPMTGNRFFDVSLDSGSMVISINTNHKAYTLLLGLLMTPENRSKIPAEELLERSAQGFQIFLASLASLENETPNPEERNKLADIRNLWGIMLAKYYKANEE